MAKKRAVGRYPKAFRKMAVERLETCENIEALSQELGVHRRLLYKWRDQWAPVEDGEQAPANSREGDLRKQINRLKRVVADKTLEANFQRCLAKRRGSTPKQRELWRDDIHDQIREVMPMQGSLSLERMCQLVGVSRAGFYRSLQEGQAAEEKADRTLPVVPVLLKDADIEAGFLFLNTWVDLRADLGPLRSMDWFRPYKVSRENASPSSPQFARTLDYALSGRRTRRSFLDGTLRSVSYRQEVGEPSTVFRRKSAVSSNPPSQPRNNSVFSIAARL